MPHWVLLLIYYGALNILPVGYYRHYKGFLTFIVIYPTYASSDPSMNTNVESLVFSMTTLSATFPGAVVEGKQIPL